MFQSKSFNTIFYIILGIIGLALFALGMFNSEKSSLWILLGIAGLSSAAISAFILFSRLGSNK
jgi:hypothetical protein